MEFDNEEIPKGWINIIFKRLIKKIPLTGKKIKQKEYLKEGTIPIIDQGQEFIGGYTEDTKRIVNCNLPVIVFGDHTKSIKFVDREFVAGADGIKVLEPNSNLNQKLLYYFMQAIQLPDRGYARHYQYLEKTIVLIPPLNEQRRIVSKIESIFAQIDAIKEQLEMLVSQTKSTSGSLSVLKKSILKQAFEGKLVPQDLNDKPTSILLKIMHKNLEITKQNNLPRGWTVTRIDEICELIGGGTPSRKNSEYFDGDIIWLTPTEIPKNTIVKIFDSKEKITALGLKKSSAKIIPQNSVLLTSRASIGYVAIAGTPVTTNQGFASFVCSNVIHNFYLAYWLMSKTDLLKIQATGTTFKEISKSKLRSLNIFLPSLNEQKYIVSKIESIFGNIDSIEKQVNDVIRSLNTLKQSVLKLAFEGKLVPQDPSDEPASVLLEKIKLQKK